MYICNHSFTEERQQIISACLIGHDKEEREKKWHFNLIATGFSVHPELSTVLNFVGRSNDKHDPVFAKNQKSRTTSKNFR